MATQLHLTWGETTRLVFEKLASAVWVFDVERKRMHWANASALRIWNSDSLEQLIERDFASDMSLATETRLKGYLGKFQRGESISDRWTFYPKGSASPVTVLSQASGIVLDDGRLAMLFEASTLEVDAVEAEKLRMVELLRHAPTLFTVFTPDGRVVVQNPASLRTHGDLGEGDAVERWAQRFSDPDALRLAVGRARRGEAVSLDARLSPGPWHEVKLFATRDPVTRDDCLLVNETNIDKLRAAQERNLQLEREATEQRMAGGFAHEVRNALAGAKIALQGVLTGWGPGGPSLPGSPSLAQANIELLQRVYELASPSVDTPTLDAMLDAMATINAHSERLDETVRMALGAVERTLELTSRILQLSKAGHDRVGARSFSLDRLLSDVVALARSEGENTKISLSLPPEPVLFHGIESHFHSIFTNLIRNAREAIELTPSPAAGEIQVELRSSGQRLIASVTDNGPGIAPELRERIFEPFFTTKGDAGTGLGLGLVRRLVEVYDGQLSLSSEPGRTTFLLTFPEPS